jgi:hypothetical protein
LTSHDLPKTKWIMRRPCLRRIDGPMNRWTRNVLCVGTGWSWFLSMGRSSVLERGLGLDFALVWGLEVMLALELMLEWGMELVLEGAGVGFGAGVGAGVDVCGGDGGGAVIGAGVDDGGGFGVEDGVGAVVGAGVGAGLGAGVWAGVCVGAGVGAGVGVDELVWGFQVEVSERGYVLDFLVSIF